MKKGKGRNMKNKKELSHAIKLKGLELGFAKVGITTADEFSDYICFVSTLVQQIYLEETLQ